MPIRRGDERRGHAKPASTVREAHYATMAIDDILALPVAALAANDAALLLWATCLAAGARGDGRMDLQI
jgi:N6-adenosine-specific RNA methylase IME4